MWLVLGGRRTPLKGRSLYGCVLWRGGEELGVCDPGKEARVQQGKGSGGAGGWTQPASLRICGSVLEASFGCKPHPPLSSPVGSGVLSHCRSLHALRHRGLLGKEAWAIKLLPLNIDLVDVWGRIIP